MRPPWPFQPLGSPALPSFNWSLVNGEVPWANVILGINIGGIGAKTKKKLGLTKKWYKLWASIGKDNLVILSRTRKTLIQA